MTTRHTDNWIPFTNCSIQIANLPTALFVDESQKTKKRDSAEKLYLLLVKLSGYADADGTNCYPGWKRIANEMSRSVRQVHRLRDGLEQLGFLIADGFVRQPGSRTATKKWRLVLPPLAQRVLGLLKDEPEQEPSPAELSL